MVKTTITAQRYRNHCLKLHHFNLKSKSLEVRRITLLLDINDHFRWTSEAKEQLESCQAQKFALKNPFTRRMPNAKPSCPFHVDKVLFNFMLFKMPSAFWRRYPTLGADLQPDELGVAFADYAKTKAFTD